MLSELKFYKQWVVRRADKVPLNPYTGEAASVTNPADWSDYATAAACCTANNGIGLGFVLTENDPFCVIDLDDPRDPSKKLTAEQIAKADEMHMKVFGAFDSYSEKSPSGKGLHIWCKASIPSGKRRPDYAMEIYASNRYMTVTFWPHHNAPIADRQQLAMDLWQQMGGADTPAAVFESQPETMSDNDVCNLCAQGSNGNGEMFVQLYQGYWQQYFHSQSEADLTFCNIVAFYTDSKEQVGRIFRDSQLGKRKKARRDEYLYHETWGIVTKAFDRKGPTIDLTQLIANGKQELAMQVAKGEYNAPETTEDEVEEDEVNTVWTQPPGLLGEISTFIYNNAINPVPEVAVSAAIAFMAALCGRSWNTKTRTGLNQYVVVLAGTGEGKESAAQGMDRLIKEVRKQLPLIERFFGPSEISSPQALIKQLVETPCFLTHKGEFGMWLQKLTGKYAKQNEITLRGFLLDLYTKSGYQQTIRGAIYSDRQKNVPDMDSPAFSLFGDSTQQEFYKALDEDNVGEGLVSRFTVIEAKYKRPIFNRQNNQIPIDAGLTWRISTIAKLALELEMLKVPVIIEETEEAHKYHMEFRERCVDLIHNDRDNKILKIWNRAHLRVLRLAGLAAVGCNPEAPVMTLEHVMWAQQVVEHSCKVVVAKFTAGEIGNTSYYLEQRKAMGRTIVKFCKSKYNEKWAKQFGISEEMFKARVVTDRYLQMYCRSIACFRNDSNPVYAYKNTLQGFIDAGNLQKIELGRIKNSARQGVAYYVTDINGLGK